MIDKNQLQESNQIEKLQEDIHYYRKWVIGLGSALLICLLLLGVIFLINKIQSTQQDQVLSVFIDIISLSTSLMSLVLAVIAIWITFHFKTESDKINQNAQDVLGEIKTEAQLISSIVIPELEKYGVTSRSVLENAYKQVNATIKMQEIINALTDDRIK